MALPIQGLLTKITAACLRVGWQNACQLYSRAGFILSYQRCCRSRAARAADMSLLLVGPDLVTFLPGAWSWRGPGQSRSQWWRCPPRLGGSWWCSGSSESLMMMMTVTLLWVLMSSHLFLTVVCFSCWVLVLKTKMLPYLELLLLVVHMDLLVLVVVGALVLHGVDLVFFFSLSIWIFFSYY